MRIGPSIDTDSLLHVTSRRQAAVVVVTARGEIDFATATRLTTVIRAAFDDDGPGTVVIDLSGVTFMGSVGIAALLEARSTAVESGRSLRIVVGDSRPVVRTLTASGLDDYFASFRNLDDALAGT